jgi:hypothetical protein
MRKERGGVAELQMKMPGTSPGIIVSCTGGPSQGFVSAFTSFFVAMRTWLCRKR